MHPAFIKTIFIGEFCLCIDFILEISGKLIAIEVKSSKTVSRDDFRHIYHLKDNLQNKFDKGIVFYTGDMAMKLDDDMFALPWFYGVRDGQ